MTRQTGAVEPAAARPLRDRRLGYFLVSRFISQAGDMAAVTALTVHVYASTGSGVAVGGLYAVRVLPRILALFGGAVGDRSELRRLLITCDLLSGAAFLLIAAAAPGYLALLGLVFVAECAATVTLPSARIMIPRTVASSHVARANGLLLAAVSIGFSAGSALGGLAAGTVGYRWAIAGNALSFVLSAGLMTRLPRVEPEAATGKAKNFVADTREGMRVVLRNKAAGPVILGLVGVAFAASLDRTALVVLVRDDLHASVFWYGLALAGVAVGAFLASLGAARVPQIESRTAAAFGLGIGAQGIAHLVMGLSPAVGVLVAGAVVAGLGNGLESVGGNTLLQRAADKRTLGLIMGVVLSGSFLANALGSVLGGVLVDAVAARATFVAAAAVIVACGIPSLRRRVPHAAAEPDPAA